MDSGFLADQLIDSDYNLKESVSFQSYSPIDPLQLPKTVSELDSGFLADQLIDSDYNLKESVSFQSYSPINPLQLPKTVSQLIILRFYICKHVSH